MDEKKPQRITVFYRLIVARVVMSKVSSFAALTRCPRMHAVND